ALPRRRLLRPRRGPARRRALRHGLPPRRASPCLAETSSLVPPRFLVNDEVTLATAFINNCSFTKSQVVNDCSFTYNGCMAPRPRETTDAAILEATARAMSRVGPARLTLAHVAKDLGIAPATLIQRFGSKRGLLLALAREVNASVGDQFAAIRAGHP